MAAAWPGTQQSPAIRSRALGVSWLEAEVKEQLGWVSVDWG